MKYRFLLLIFLFSSGLQAQNGSGVVINEFLASSDSLSGIPDPAGSFADWIEIYNNNDYLVNLSGFYLSDDYFFFDKFIFPGGAVIDGDGYVIIWADQDLNEAGLHADFHLNKSGEEVILTNSDLIILDSISFGPQETNVSLARIPNGTGDFTPRAPTFSANNGSGASAIKIIPPAEIQISPNPGAGPFTVQWPDEYQNQPASWTLMDLQGRSIALSVESSSTGVNGDSQFILHPQAGLSGIFLLWIRIENQYVVKRLIIQSK